MVGSDRVGGDCRLSKLSRVLSRRVSVHVLGPVFMLSLCLEKLVMSLFGDMEATRQRGVCAFYS